MSIRPVAGKSLSEIAREWDDIAEVRHRQIASGEDLSFSHVLLPTIRTLLDGCSLENTVDVGCGTGQLTSELAGRSASVAAIDTSARSIGIARESCADQSNVSFHVSSIEEFAMRWPSPQFTTAVANMTLMTCLDLRSFMQAVATVVVPTGSFVATITHPWFWPHYRGYANASWFSYCEEMILEGPFNIALEFSEHVTTHVHRPLVGYLDTLSHFGFRLNQVLEPYPGEEIQELYPDPWQFPRFLALRASLDPT